MKLRADFNWKLVLFVVLFLPILLRLGFWQLERAGEKRQIQQAYQALVGEQPVDYARLGENQWKNWQNVHVIGEFRPEQFLLDNQMYRGKFGYELIQPLHMPDGEVLLVSRGWVAGSLDRSQLPAVKTPGGKVELQGYLYRPTEGYELADNDIAGGKWPVVVQTANVEKMYKAMGGNGKIRRPFLLRLHEGDTQLLTAHWQVINVQPEKHTAYAMQWFGMALLLVIMFIVASFKRESTSTGE